MNASTPFSSPERRLLLMETAAPLFARFGFDKTSVDDLARAAGISKGGVYLEFPSKEALFRAVIHHELLRYSQDWLRRFNADPGAATFAQIMRHSLAAIDANPLVKALMTRDGAIFGGFLRRNPDLLTALVSVRTELFRQLQEAGVLRTDLDPPVLAHLVSVIGFGVVAGHDVIPEPQRADYHEVLTALAALLDRGLSPEAPKGKAAEARRKKSHQIIAGIMETMSRTLAAQEEALSKPQSSDS